MSIIILSDYAFNRMRRIEQIMDLARRFTATVTSDWNGHITSVQKVIPGRMNVIGTFTYPSASFRTVRLPSIRRTMRLSDRDGSNHVVWDKATLN